MIHTSKQLKDKVRNISKGDNNIAEDDAQRIVYEICADRVDKVILLQAFRATCKKRETVFSKEEIFR